MIEPRILESCIKRFAQESNILAVWILGSAVSGRLPEDSDVDFAVLYSQGAVCDFEQLGQLSVDLESMLGRRVDLGRLDTRNLVYAFQAIREGRLIYQCDLEASNGFIERATALYFDLKRDRKVVEDAYCAG